MKRCGSCKRRKAKRLFHKNRLQGDGLKNRCKACITQAERLRKYGTSAKEFQKILTKQHGRCRLCRLVFARAKRQTKPNVDHCHKTGRVRGLLCGTCNAGIGLLKESPKLLRLAASYMEAV